MKNKVTINFQVEEVMRILEDLEFLIVSLDRIGSAQLAEEARKAEVYDFVIEGAVFRRLSAARKFFLERLDEGASSGIRDTLEQKLEKVKPWKIRR